MMAESHGVSGMTGAHNGESLWSVHMQQARVFSDLDSIWAVARGWGAEALSPPTHPEVAQIVCHIQAEV